MSPNPAEEISLIHIHMQIVHPEDKKKKDIILREKRVGGGREGSSAYHHRTDVQTMCWFVCLVAEPEQSKAPSLARLNEPSPPAAAKGGDGGGGWRGIL